MRHVVAIVLTVLLASSEAPAQSRAGWRLGIERAFGFTWSSITSPSETTSPIGSSTHETTLKLVTLNLFGASPTSIKGYNLAPPPRVTLDYEFPSHLTLGTSLFFSYSSFDTGRALLSESLDSTTFGIAPRVGYSIQLGESVAFWPRVGVTIAYSSSSVGDSSEGLTSLWINVEPTIVYTPVPHVGLMATLVADLPLVGDISSSSSSPSSSSSHSLKQLSIGLQFGIQARF